MGRTDCQADGSDMMDASEDGLAHLYLADVTVQFGKLKDLAERAIARVSDQQLKATLDADGNSIAVLIQHMAGNLRSRWTDFLTTDGEKPDRDRDAEFEVSAGVGRAHLLGLWEEGWSRLFEALAALTPADLQRTVQVRAEPHSVPQAIHRQLTHHAYHVGQLVLLARHFAAGSWESLSVPRGKSRERNAEMFGRSRR
jgi:Protein of unknown function (DUF1572)